MQVKVHLGVIAPCHWYSKISGSQKPEEAHVGGCPEHDVVRIDRCADPHCSQVFQEAGVIGRRALGGGRLSLDFLDPCQNVVQQRHGLVLEGVAQVQVDLGKPDSREVAFNGVILEVCWPR